MQPVLDESPPDASWRHVFLSRPFLAAVAVGAFALGAEFVPALAPLRLLSTPEEQHPTTLDPEPESSAPPELTPPTPALDSKPAPPVAGPWFSDPPPKVPLESADPHALDGFFRALELTRAKHPDAVTRVIHFGDSVIASDYVSGTLRRLLQQRFGDAGHGFTLVAPAWPGYSHNDIESYSGAGWKLSRIVTPFADDGLYGLGGVSFEAEKNVIARVATNKKSDFGRVSRFGVSYLASPEGGTFQISVDGHVRTLVDTHGDAKQARVHTLVVPDGPHEFELLTKSGKTRLFGFLLERDGPGVVLDAIGVQGARVRFLDKQDDAHWAEQLQSRDPALLIYEFGANESADGLMYPMADYHRTMKEVLAQGQRAVPRASCLVVGIMDRASKRGDEIRSLSIVPRLLAEQRAVAAELGCAFFDTYHAMGGAGSMPNWVKRGLGQADLTHPSSIGADMIGTWIFRALMQRYGEFLASGGAAGGAANSASNTSPPRLR